MKYPEQVMDFGNVEDVPKSQITKKKSHIKEHVESHIEGLSFPCQSCGKKCRSRQALRFHHQYYQKYKSKGENGCHKVKKVLIMS